MSSCFHFLNKNFKTVVLLNKKEYKNSSLLYYTQYTVYVIVFSNFSKQESLIYEETWVETSKNPN